MDALGDDFDGYIEDMSVATGDRTSVLPSKNATGNYVKVIQRLPVRKRAARDFRQAGGGYKCDLYEDASGKFMSGPKASEGADTLLAANTGWVYLWTGIAAGRLR